MPTLVATLGAANANSMLTVEQANTYFDNSLSGQAWAEFDDDTKARALIGASAALAGLFYWGDVVTAGQAMPFPRTYPGASDGTAIPREIVAATAEHALALAIANENGDSVTSTRMQMRAEGVTSYRNGDRAETFSPLSYTSTTGTLSQFSGAVQRSLSRWVRNTFPLDSGRYGYGSSNPGCGYDCNGLPWPQELL